MIENLYSFLATMGFTHPLHPMLTHLPMGMIIGMVVFGLLAALGRSPIFGKTAYHCSVLALLGVFPVILTGLLDWQQFQEGELSGFIVVKMVLGVILTALLAVSVVLKKKDIPASRMALLYLLCLACAGGLGYSGGELVYG